MAVVEIGFGIDVSVLNGPAQDLDDTFNEINSIEVLGQDVYKAVSCSSNPAVIVVDDAVATAATLPAAVTDSAPLSPSPAPLIFWENPYVSFDLRDRLNDTIDPAERASIEGYIQAVYVADDRFDNGVSAAVTFDQSSNELRAEIEGQASGVPLRLVLTAGSNQISVEAA